MTGSKHNLLEALNDSEIDTLVDYLEISNQEIVIEDGRITDVTEK